MKNKNIILMCAIAFLQGMVFYSAVSTIYRQTQGITLLEMGIIESVLSILILILEVPWGMVCDRIGYKKTLIICNFIYLLSKIVFWRADSFMLFLCERILLGIVISGLSGCDSALIYVSTGKEEAAGVFGYYHASSTIRMMIASLMFSLFIKDDILKSGVWTIYPYALAFLLTFFLKDVKGKNDNITSFSKEGFSYCLKSLKKMFLFLIAATLLTETTHTLGVFYNQLQYEQVGISVEWYGILYTLMTLCTLVNGGVGKLIHKVHMKTLITILYGVVFIACLILSVTLSPILSVFGIALLQICEALYYPLLDTIMNIHAKVSRATILSVYSMIMNLGSVLTNLMFGKCADITVSYAFILGCIFSIIGILLFRHWSKSHMVE